MSSDIGYRSLYLCPCPIFTSENFLYLIKVKVVNKSLSFNVLYSQSHHILTIITQGTDVIWQEHS